MSARERNRYLTVTVVFLTVLIVLGSLMVKSAIVMAQAFTFRPRAGISNINSGTPTTQDLGLAFDANALTAARTYTNVDFNGDGLGTVDEDYTFSGRWAAFDQTTTLIKNIGLYVIREGALNAAEQWRIQYSIDGMGGPWETLDAPGLLGTTDNPPKGEVRAFDSDFPNLIIPDTTDLESLLVVRTTSRQRITSDTDSVLDIFDIRVEADWDQSKGGSSPLQIDTDGILPAGEKNVAYTPMDIGTLGGISPYSWCLVGGSMADLLPAGMTFTPPLSECPTSAENATIQLSGTPTEAGDFTFTIKVTDTSSTPQTASEEFTLQVAGLSIVPPGPTLSGWDPIVFDESGGQTFTAEGGTADYYWCLVSGSTPEPVPGLTWSPTLAICPAVTTAASIYLSGTPDDPGVYSFTIKLADSGGETPATHHYVAEVGSSFATILKRRLNPVVKGIEYGTGAAHMTPQYLRAINVVYSTDASTVTWTPTGLPAGFSFSTPPTLNTTAKTSSVFVGGTIDVGTASGKYDFTANISDGGAYQDTESFELEVLERRTLLRKTPPSAVALPDNNTLDFVVSGKGGAPNDADESTGLHGASIPYYTYYWEVTPVDGAAALGTPSDTASGETPNPPYEPGPLSVPITFEDSAGEPVIGTYLITFWAEDYLRRQNSSDDAYEFVPASARIKIISPAGRTLEKDATRPTLLRQEQF